MSQSPSSLIDQQQVAALCRLLEPKAQDDLPKPPAAESSAIRFSLSASAPPPPQDWDRAATPTLQLQALAAAPTAPGPERSTLELTEAMRSLHDALTHNNNQPMMAELRHGLTQLVDLTESNSAFIADAAGLPVINDHAQEEHIVLSASMYRAIDSVRFGETLQGQFMAVQVNPTLILHLFWIQTEQSLFAIGLLHDTLLPTSSIYALSSALMPTP